MNMIFISSSFTDEIQSHYDSSEADVLPPSSSEEEKIEKTREYQRELPSQILQREAADNHTCVEFVEKLFPTALISEDMKSLRRCTEAKTTV